MQQNKKAKTYILPQMNVVQLNQILADIASRLSALEGIGQNVDHHGAKQINVTSGTSKKQVVTADYTAEQQTQTLATAKSAVVGYTVPVTKVATVAGASNITGVSVNSGSDQIDLADANNQFSTLGTQVDAIVTVLNNLIAAARAAGWMS